MTTFSAVGCNQSTGLSQAATTATSVIDLIVSKAQTTLSDGLSAATDLSDFSFPVVNYSVNFSSDGQLETWGEPNRPEQDYNDLSLADINVPNVPTLDDITELDISTYWPGFDSSLLTKLVTELCDIIDNNSDGLPTAWFDGNVALGRDRLYQEVQAQQAQITGEFSRRGWSAPTGAETARKDAAVAAMYAQFGALTTTLVVKRYEEQLASYRFALQQIIAYLNAWVDAYKAWIDAQSRRENVTAQNNALRVQRFQQQLALFEAKLRKEIARVESLNQSFRTEAALYQADASISDSISRRDQAAFDQETRRRELSAQKELQESQAIADERRRDITQSVENLRTLVDIYRQVISSLWQAVNVGASMSSSSSFGQSKSCSTSYSFSESA